MTPLVLFLARLKPLWRWIGLVVVAAGLAGFGYRSGVAHERAAQAARVRAAKVQVAKIDARAGAITADVGAKVETRQAQIRTVTRTLIEKVPVYVTAKADAACSVPLGFVRLHDAAAAGRVPDIPDAAGGADDAASGVALSAVAAAVVDNYGRCIGDQARLSALQDWVRRQAAGR